MPHSTDPVVGRFFHTLDARGEVDRQGRVIERTPEGLYLVMWFSWISGEPNGEQLVAAHDMRGWRFFPNNLAMIEAGDAFIARQRQRIARGASHGT